VFEIKNEVKEKNVMGKKLQFEKKISSEQKSTTNKKHGSSDCFNNWRKKINRV